jgi:hypothetical protein
MKWRDLPKQLHDPAPLTPLPAKANDPPITRQDE